MDVINMLYETIVHGIFKKRHNRFIAEVSINEKTERVHVKNTGRCKELLISGVEVLLEHVNRPNRKTNYSLIAVNKNGNWINIDSQAPNQVVYEGIQSRKIADFGEVTYLKRETTFQSSRFDFYYENEKEKGFIEVKGVTLEKDGVAMFPDAPTTRGTKHVRELIDATQEGYAATVLFVVQMKGCSVFRPNVEMDPAFTEALIEAKEKGVRIFVYDCIVSEDTLTIDQPVPLKI